MAAEPRGVTRVVTFFDGPVLGIETSCDETSAAVVDSGAVLSNVVVSQARLHEQWGGIVPEAAARAHVEAMLPVLSTALDRAGVSLRDVRAIGVTNRPGLVGALSVGVTTAKALSLALDVPLLGVHHLEGHVLSTLAAGPPPFPHACLIASGGHTELVLVEQPMRYRMLAETVDDAAGEAFDKSARLLGLGYPGGSALERAAIGGRTDRYPLPTGLANDPVRFSFSGLKTAVLRLVERLGADLSLSDAAASIQEAIVSALVEKCVRALDDHDLGGLTIVGGVAANARLRERLAAECARMGAAFVPAPMDLCTDNAAMIALTASLRLARGERDDTSLDVHANADLPGLA